MNQLKVVPEENIGPLPIGKMNKHNLAFEMKSVMKSITMDFGIAYPSQDVMARICEILVTTKGHWYVYDVVKMFNLNLNNVLDPFFYRDRQGVPDKQHYSKMTPEYWMKVTGAYEKYLMDQRIKFGVPGQKLLGKTDLSEKEIQDIHVDYSKQICEWFEKDFPKKPFPFITSEFNYRIFLQLGLVPEWGLTDLVHKPKVEKRKISRDEIKSIGKMMSSGSMHYQYGVLINEACAELKKKKKSLRAIMEEKYGFKI